MVKSPKLTRSDMAEADTSAGDPMFQLAIENLQISSKKHRRGGERRVKYQKWQIFYHCWGELLPQNDNRPPERSPCAYKMWRNRGKGTTSGRRKEQELSPQD